MFYAKITAPNAQPLEMLIDNRPPVGYTGQNTTEGAKK